VIGLVGMGRSRIEVAGIGWTERIDRLSWWRGCLKCYLGNLEERMAGFELHQLRPSASRKCLFADLVVDTKYLMELGWRLLLLLSFLDTEWLSWQLEKLLFLMAEL